MAGFRTIGRGAALALVAALPSTAQQIDLFGVNSATLEWSPASGAVSGYYVIVARNGGTPSLQGVATETRATVESAYGDTVTVQVAAFDTSGVAGPLSQPSNAIRFNAPIATEEPAPDPTTEPDPGSTTDPDAVPTPDVGSETPVATRFDFTGDGLSDLLLRDPTSGKLILWTMEGSQVTAQSQPENLPFPWTLEEPGDYDGDGTADLLWRNASTGQLAVWIVRAGQVVSGGNVDLGTVTSEWTISSRGDFDGDGRDDIVLARPLRGTVELLHMNGLQIVSRVARNAPSNRWRVVAAPDADGDGVAEIVWEHVDSHALAIEAIATPGQVAPVAAEAGDWRVLGAGDFDGDGRDDLLVRQPSTGQVHVWLLHGSQAQLAPWDSTPGSNWTYRGLGDFDGDGRSDAFWHDASGVVELWFQDEDGVTSAFASSFTGDDVPAGDPVN